MTRREGVATYKALEWNSSRIVVTKVIKKSKWNAAFQSSLQRLQKLDSPYLVRYVKCCEDEKEYRVWKQLLCNGIDWNRELWIGIIERMHGYNGRVEWRCTTWDCKLLSFGSRFPSFSPYHPWCSWTLITLVHRTSKRRICPLVRMEWWNWVIMVYPFHCIQRRMDRRYAMQHRR